MYIYSKLKQNITTIIDCRLFALTKKFTATKDNTLSQMLLTGVRPYYSVIILIVRRFTVVSRRSVVVGLRVWHVWRRVLPILRRGAGRRHAIPVPLVAIHCKQQLHWTTVSQPPNINTCQTNPVTSLLNLIIYPNYKLHAIICIQTFNTKILLDTTIKPILEPIIRMW